MKHQILLKSLFLLLLILAISSIARASEVLGTLSSNGLNSNSPTNVPNVGAGGSTIVSGSNGMLFGTVTNGNISSAGSNVLGGAGGSGNNIVGNAIIVSNAPKLAVNSGTIVPLFSDDGMAFGPASSNLALGNQTGINTSGLTPTGGTSSSQIAAALSGFGNFSFSNWFWIIFLLLLLIAFIIYIYRRPLSKNKVRTI
jgi:hypothetical protein